MAVHCNGRLRYVQVTFEGVQVPHLVGLRPEQASKRLALIDLSLGSVTYRSSRGAKAGTIVEQSARHGKVLASGGRVDVVVAKP
ncbi:MAG: PASTA domain-containing protein [Actinomycetota bacterium]|nr:PASTA domain-containing protein [Actinomycetota bacterium]